jgi:hypothetical protein
MKMDLQDKPYWGSARLTAPGADGHGNATVKSLPYYSKTATLWKFGWGCQLTSMGGMGEGVERK